MNTTPENTQEIADCQMTIEQLATEAGMTVRNVRAYTTAGLLPPPFLRGRLGLYGDKHLSRLHIIRTLREQGMSLTRIKNLVTQDRATPIDATWRYLGELAQTLATHMPPLEEGKSFSISDAENIWKLPLTAERKAKIERAGMQRINQDGTIQHYSPDILAVGHRMAELGLSLDEMLSIQEKLSNDLRLAMRNHIRQLLTSLNQHARDTGKSSVDIGLLAELPALMERFIQGMMIVLLKQEMQRFTQTSAAQLSGVPQAPMKNVA